jgi:hypothetical protein
MVVWKLENNDGKWQDLVRSKYVHCGPIAFVDHKQFYYAYWFDILKLNQLYMDNRTMRTRMANQTSFYDDALCTSWPLRKNIHRFMKFVMNIEC